MLGIASFLLFIGFNENGRDESEESSLIGKERSDSGSSFDFTIESFEHIGS